MISTFYRAFEEVVPFDSAYAYKITYPVRETMMYFILIYALSDLIKTHHNNTSLQHDMF